MKKGSKGYSYFLLTPSHKSSTGIELLCVISRENVRAHPSLANSQQAEKRSVQATQILSISHSKVGCVFLVDKTLETFQLSI